MSPALWMSLLLLLTLAPPALPKRGGISMGRSGGRGSSSARSGGGLFGGGSSSRSRVAPAPPPRSHGGGFGNSGGHKTSSGGTWGNTGSHGTGWGHSSGGSGWNRNTNPKHSGSGFGHGHTSTGRGLGGLFGRKTPSRPHGFSKGSGVGSVFRSNTFKNAIVGAAAGYLTYQAGKAIIRAAAGPMMWNHRPYYWGSNHYRPSHGQSNMCRMPIDSNDQQFGNVYFQDNTRPREIVWGCGYYEYCCGYECCRGGGVSGYGLPAGYAFAIAYLVRAYLF